MKNINISAFESIKEFEDAILQTKKYSSSDLGAGLHQLSDFRKDTYAEFAQNLNQDNNDATILFDEYDQYCGFILEVLCTKKLSNATWSKIVSNFIREYDLIQPYDSNNFAYNATLSTLEYLSQTLYVSDLKTSDYRFRCTNNLINQFNPASSIAEKELS